MKYAKPPLSLEQQANLLLARGMQGDRATMMARLAVVNYYRLSGYPYVPRGSMGVPAEWEQCPIWTKPDNG